ncbi:MAG: amidohydrolase family protein [Pyrinomonadaceae bacterium]
MKKLLTTACLFVVTIVAIVSFTASPAELLAQTRPTAQSQPLVFTHVTVIDVAARDAKRALKLDQTVIVTGERITALGKTGKVQIPEGARVIDATGKFLIPGLWDMHVHMFNGNWDSVSALNLFLVNGVTGVRDMGSNLERILALRQQIASGSLLGPRMVVSGPAVYGMAGPPDARSFISAEDARGAVRRLKQAGVDTIKLYSYLSPAAFFAAVDEAKKQGLTAVGHVPFAVRASEAAKAGLKSIEHLEGVVIESSDLEDALREEISVRIREGKKGIQVPQIETDQTERYRDSYNPKKLQDLSAQFVKYHTWHCATLISPESAGHVVDALGNDFASYPYLRYVSKARRDSWKRGLSDLFSPDQIPNIKVYAAYKRVLTTAMHREGVQFLAGTDAPALGQVPGFSLHDELALFVQVGFSPLEALRTATVNPARFFGKEKELGTIERGKLADLVLLDANPLNNIDNTRRINAVVVNGRHLPKDALQKMLAEAEADANKKSIAETVSATILEKGIAPALEQYRELREKRSDTYNLDEDEMNDAGYKLLRMRKVSEAIEIFKLNVDAFPKSSNVYDSLGEAYMENGNKELAIKNYQKSVELNPKNTNGIEMLKKLQAK